jgi:glycerol uptake facilitator-like aquaporin
VGAFIGVAAAHMMFELPLFFASQRIRSGPAQMFSEFVATFGLVTVIFTVSRSRASAVPFAVAAYIVAAYWFTSSTSFANPAVTAARALTNTFTGIRPADVPAFLVSQVGGAVASMVVCRWLAGGARRRQIEFESGATLR